MRHVLIPIILAALSLAGCNEADVYPLSVDATKNRLSDKAATYFYKDNKILMRFERGAGHSVAVKLRGKLWMAECTILLEPVDETSTRLVPDCGKSDNEYQQKGRDAKKPLIMEKAREILSSTPF
ncbi:hypothetical protein [Erythrobacter sp. WG]|uniref:hypothetical protein n=1 Tax=Erythrobacter sp. WG TaxID=2985510 RepID=UPI002271EA31|nr:hypothetical protein [Erythrobacter sp. WG]MCX9146759.1 hypothetical protein [Erythrobacter sp. WG]